MKFVHGSQIPIIDHACKFLIATFIKAGSMGLLNIGEYMYHRWWDRQTASGLNPALHL